MVEEVGYTSRVRVQAGAALPGVSADSMGAGIGQAVEQAGAVIQQERLEDARLDRSLRDNAEWSAALVEDAKAREELSAIAREGRNSDEPGHAERIAKALAERQERLLGMVSTPRLKQQMQARVSEWGGNLRSREADWEFLRGQEIAIEGFEEQRGIAEGRVRRLDTPADYKNELQLQVEAINVLNTSDKVKQALIDETEQRFAVAFLRGGIDRDPAATRALIDSGAFDGIITGDQVEVLRNSSEVEIRRVEAQREREAAEARANVKSRIGVFRQAESMGLVQDDAAYDEAITAAATLGDDELVLELTGLKANNNFTKVWGPENATALQREQRLAVLAAKDKLAPEELLEREFLRKHAGAWASEEARDPVTQASRRGGQGAPPLIDLNDGTSWNDRAAWMTSRGGNAAFAEVELRELQDAIATPAGELQVMGELDKVRDPFARSRMAEQIAPNDPTFRQMAMLRPGVRATVRQGRKAMVNNPKFFSNLETGIEARIAAADSQITFALREYDDDLKLGTRETMRQFIAGNLAAQGRPDASSFVDGDGAERTIKSAIAHALGGGYVMRDGKKVLVGGIEDWAGRAYVLPPTMNEAAFKQRLQAELTSTKNPPVNPDGSTANLYRLTPVAIGGGLYRFENASGTPVKARDGSVYQFRVSQ